ncbi:MAG TPA: DUF2442 domain-containing protein [Gemmatimonadaceae bacterium]|nr:DUF2442 domain-containing protein [Gemmatimonadaceae bacterium]HRQ77544.1 DUF2442 domain-containing protein [Gemmatimonadaceae bacterium]
MRRKPLSTAEILAQIPAARRAEAADRTAGRRALSASYDRSKGRVLIELSNGSLFGFVASQIPALAGMTDADLARVTVSPGGISIHWDDLDIGLSVPGLLLDAVERSAARSELARIAGSTRSRAKAAASRANGKKGGRPRKRPAASGTKSKR